MTTTTALPSVNQNLSRNEVRLVKWRKKRMLPHLGNVIFTNGGRFLDWWRHWYYDEKMRCLAVARNGERCRRHLAHDTVAGGADTPDMWENGKSGRCAAHRNAP